MQNVSKICDTTDAQFKWKSGIIPFAALFPSAGERQA